jgi:hypothetical protein
MFVIKDIENIVIWLHAPQRRTGWRTDQYEDSYRLRYIGGREGVIAALADPLR